MNDTGISQVLVIDSVLFLTRRGGYSVVVAPPKNQKLGRNETAFGKLRDFEEENDLTDGLFALVRRKVAVYGGISAREVEVKPTRIDFPYVEVAYVLETGGATAKQRKCKFCRTDLLRVAPRHAGGG